MSDGLCGFGVIYDFLEGEADRGGIEGLLRRRLIAEDDEGDIRCGVMVLILQ